MSVTTLLFDVLAPVAVLVILGALAGPKLDIDLGSLSRLAYYVFGPAFVFAVLADAQLEYGTVVKLVLSGLAGMVAAATVALVWARVVKASYEVGAAAVITSAYGNVGNAGLAIVGFALGDEALPIAGVLMLTINISGLVLAVALAQIRTRSPGAAVARGLSSPLAISGALALAVNLSDVDLPLVADRSIDLLAGALIPVMLFTLGIQLVKSGRPTWTGDLPLVMVAKLAVAPLVAGLVAAGLNLDGDFLDAVIIQSAMPPAVFCAVVAIEYDLAPDRVTAAVVVTTLASALTLPLVLFLV